MRVSVVPGDPGYTGAIPGCRILLDGIERIGVLTADEEQRIVVMHRRDETGAFVLSADGTEIAQVTLHGDVTIVLTELYAGRTAEVRRSSCDVR